MAVRHGKVVIQDAFDFLSWASSEGGCIDYLFISVEDYEESKNILTDLMIHPSRERHNESACCQINQS